MKITLPNLSFDYNALEPFIDEQTMSIHHDLHHAGYIAKLNATLQENPPLLDRDLIDIMKNLKSLELPEKDKSSIINNGGGHINHSLFWQILGPKKEIDEELNDRIKTTFGSVKSFKEEFNDIASSRFGSGWAWLVDSNSTLKIYSTPNQDSPYLTGDIPIIGLDVWEHAYYLKYQNRRPEYIEAWWNVLKVI